MKGIIGIGLILVGISLGVYLGGWVMLVGGIVQLVNAVKATPVEALSVALGLLRVLSAGLVGWVVALLLILPGLHLTRRY